MTLRKRIEMGWASPSEEESFNGSRRSRHTNEITDDHAKAEPEEYQREDE